MILASTTSHCSLNFDGFMVHRNVQPECTTTDFVHQLEQRLEETTGFRIPFAVKEHHSFTQLLRARAGEHEYVLLVEHQGNNGGSISMSACALAFGFTTGRWMSAIRAVNTAERAGGCLTVRRWFEVFNEDNLTNPIVPCPSVGFLPPAEGGGPDWSSSRTPGHTYRPSRENFHRDCYSPIVHDVFSRCFIRQCCRGNPPRTPGRRRSESSEWKPGTSW